MACVIVLLLLWQSVLLPVLALTQDARNKSIQTNHDIGNRRETVTDRMGHVSVMDYDAYGNVTRSERFGKSYNALGQWVDVSVVATSTYDLDSKNPEQPTSTTEGSSRDTILGKFEGHNTWEVRGTQYLGSSRDTILNCAL